MATEYSANTIQEVATNASVIFTESPVPCNRGLVYHRDESGIFRLASPSTINCGCITRRCCCSGMPVANYVVSYHGNIAIPEGGTAGAISLALAIDGEVDPSSIMTITPLVGEFQNVGSEIIVSVPAICRCSSVSVRNVSTQSINVENSNLVIDFAGIQ